MRRIFFFILLFLVTIYPVYSISMNNMPKEERFVLFEPYYQKEFSMVVFNAPKIESYVIGGELEQYMTLIDPEPYGSARELRMILKFEDYLKPGLYTIYFGGREISEIEGTVSARAAVASAITVLSLYDGQYPVFGVALNDVARNQKTNVTVSVENYGKQRIDSARAVIEIYDPNNNLVNTLYTNSGMVESKMNLAAVTTLTVVFDSFGLNPGVYKWKAKLEYDGQSTEYQEGTFRIGDLTIRLLDHTTEVYANTTNRVIVRIESDWVGVIDDVYMRLFVPKNGPIKSPDLDMQKFQTASLEAYWETKGLDLGTYDIPVEIYYSGKTLSQTIKINVINSPVPIKEEPKPIGNTLIIIIVALAVLAAFNIYYFILRKNNDEGKNKTAATSSAGSSTGRNSTIRPPPKV